MKLDFDLPGETRELTDSELAKHGFFSSVATDEQLETVHRELDSLLGGEGPIPYEVIEP